MSADTGRSVAQLDLFAGGPRVRRSDPATSRAAANSLTRDALNNQCRAVLTAVHLLEVAGHPGVTAYELATDGHTAWPDLGAIQQSVASRRLTDLRRRHLVRDTGRTRPGSTGRQLAVYRITDQGRQALR